MSSSSLLTTSVGEDGPRIRHVDGPAASRPRRTRDGAPSGPPRWSTSLAPILTPPLPSSGSNSRYDGDDDGEDNDGAEQYLLVPESRRIVVRSARRGRRVCDLLPRVDDKGGEGRAADGDIRAVALAWLPAAPRVKRIKGQGEDDSDESDDGEDDDSEDESEDGDDGEWIVLAACGGGIVREWSLADLSSETNDHEDGVTAVGPRRSHRLTCAALKDPNLIHLASTGWDASGSPSSGANTGGAVLYGLAAGTAAGAGGATSWLVRCVIPPFAPSKEGGASPLPAEPLASVKTTSSKSSQDKHICLRKGDGIFGMLVARRPSSSKSNGDDQMEYELDDDRADTDEEDVFVVMCASHGLIILRDDSPRGAASPSRPPSLVHFAKSIKSTNSHHRDESRTALCSAALSPGSRDLALGRADGRIEVLDDVLSNAAAYLDGRGDHPDEATVRRTVHWHAHPVRALTYVPSRGGPTTLLSGGEEGVLATWQLDRNPSRPSDFVARVGQGGIVHVSCCPKTGRVYVFCADNSVSGYDGSTHQRDWMERGLATAELHEEEAEGGGDEGDDEDGRPRRGPVVMVPDPITRLPMLTNLPGAPGMVHWYDPRSASVVGTLEVAPYNRVSRRDPSDPHVPAPTVTHLATGRDGKDMVTVDTVWTENASVGAAHRLPGPGGTTVSMNACTSVKFWSHVDPAKGGRPDRRGRGARRGDVPVNYELVSSMASPHGSDGGVCALAMSPDGHAACTLSREEDAFRLWVKNTDTGGAAGASATTLWKCLYRVKTPSGYSNLLSRAPTMAASRRQQQLVSFSSDGSVLSVSYGPYATLWDHSDATMLSSLALDGDGDGIRTAGFLAGDDDALLLTAAGRVGVRSPFGGARRRYLGDDEWSSDAGPGGVVSAAVPLRDGSFAVAVARASGSVVSIVGRDGAVARGAAGPLRWRVDGEVRSLCADGRGAGPPAQLLAIAADGRMLSLGSRSGGRGSGGTKNNGVRAERAPVLQSGATMSADARPAKRRRVSVGAPSPRGSRGDGGRDASGFEFPISLSGKFTSAFVARGL